MIQVKEVSEQREICPICAGFSFKPYRLGLIRCESCNVVLSHVIWREHANEQLEDEWFGEEYQAESSFWVVLFEKWNSRKTLSRLAKAKPQGWRLLEIGVGSGSFLNAAR